MEKKENVTSSKIRRAKKSDLIAVSKIFRAESSKKPYMQEWKPSTGLKHINSLFDNGVIFVAQVNDKVVGFIATHQSKHKKEAHVEELWVSASFQGRGLGTALMSAAEKFYKKKGIGTIGIVAHQKAASACKFYQGLKYKNKHPLVYMHKTIK